MERLLIVTYFFIFSISNTLCQDNITAIFNEIHSKASLLPTGSTIYFSRNIKCSIYSSSISVCLFNNSLYTVSGENQYSLLTYISEYSDSFYYELFIFQYGYTHCLLPYFFNANKLKIKHYVLNINEKKISNVYEYEHNGDSMKPINNIINCHFESKSKCYYINQDKDIVEMTITVNNFALSSIDFKTVKITDNNFINNNTFIMSSLLNNKFKLFSCYNYNEKKTFNIYLKKRGNFDSAFKNQQDYVNDMKQLDFVCNNKEKLILFAVLNEENSQEENEFSKMNISVFVQNYSEPIIKYSKNCNKLRYEDEGKINLFFFQPKTETDFQLPETTYINDNEVQTTINALNDNNINVIETNESLKYNKSSETSFEIANIYTYSKHIIPEEKEQIKELSITLPNITKEAILENIEDIINNTVIGETYEYQQEDFTIFIYPTDSTFLTNKTHIDFEECESTLKTYYNLSNQSTLTFFQMEISSKNEHSLINQVEYQVYDEQKNQLDLSKCNNSNIKIYYGIKSNSSLDMSIITSFKDSGVNVFNISDGFFNDVCYSYSEDGNDLILEDRIKNVYQNYTLCEEGCTFDSIDISTMLISCQCNVKQNMTTTIKEIKEEAVEKITSLNFEIVRCFNLVFSFKGKMKNIGFWILSLFFLFYIIFLIKYSCEGIKPVKDYILNEMTKFGYINKGQFKKLTKNDNNINEPPKKVIKKVLRTTINPLNKNNSQNNRNNMIKRHTTNNNNTNKSIKKSSSENKNIKNLDLNLISINLNDLSKRNIAPKESNITLYNYTMEEAFKYDRRNILVILYVYLLSKQAFFHAFLYRSPLVLFPLRFCLLLFILSSDLALNAFFYFNDNISRKYKNTKNIFIFTFSNNMTVILLSTLVGFFFLTLFTNLSNSTKAIRDIFKNEEKKIRKNKKYKVTSKMKEETKKKVLNILDNYKSKLIILFFIQIILMVFFWYYVVAFCHVFAGTQTSWLINSILSILSRFIIDLILCLIFAKLYRIGVASNYNCIYKLALFFYGFC